MPISDLRTEGDSRNANSLNSGRIVLLQLRGPYAQLSAAILAAQNSTNLQAFLPDVVPPGTMATSGINT